MVNARKCLAGGMLFLAAGIGGPALADEPALIGFSAGAFDVGKDETAFEARVEYRSDARLWIFKPFAGAMVHGDGGGYLFAGVLVDVPVGDRFIATFSFAPGAYHRGSGKDLGHVLEFRSQIELGYRFADQSRLALAFSHMSNASLGEDNPGAESLMLTYAVPLHALGMR